MNIEQMNYVVVLAEELSFSLACQRLHISQPALSQSIKNLEKQLGVVLFRRTTTELQITYAGEQFVKAAQKILATQNTLFDILDDISNLERGRITIGVPNFRGQIILAKTIPQFVERYPNVEINVIEATSSKLIEQCAKGLVDVAIMNEPDSIRGISFIPLFQERILLAAPPNHKICSRFDSEKQDFKNLPKISISELNGENFVILKPGHKLRETTNTIFEQTRIKKKIVMEVNNLLTAQQLVANGVGFSFEGEMAARYAIQTPKPVFFEIENYSKKSTIVAAFKIGAYMSHINEAYIQIVKNAFQGLSQ